MKSYFEHNHGTSEYDNVIPFEKPDKKIEHVDSTTIVERMEMTDEIKAEFEKNGYTIEE